MGLTTYTRKDIRRMLCRRLRLPFYRRIGNYSTLEAGCTTSILVDSKLTQEDDYWTGSFLYISDSEEDCNQEWRLINNFLSAGDQITLEFPLSSAPAAEDEYEIISLWSPDDIHDAINQAIESAWPFFFETNVDDVLVLEEEKKEYSLIGLSSIPWMITKVWLEGNSTGSTSSVESSTNDTVTLPSTADLTNLDSNWKVSIYAGTGSGQLRDVSSVAGQEITISSVWTTNPDITSKLRYWNPANQSVGWFLMRNYDQDRKEFPDNIYLQSIYTDSYGLRLRVEYLSKPTLLDDDADTVVIPSEYLMHKAMSILYSQVSSDHGIDMSTYDRLSQRHQAEAEDLKNKLAFRVPNITFRSYAPDRLRTDGNNPIGW